MFNLLPARHFSNKIFVYYVVTAVSRHLWDETLLAGKSSRVSNIFSKDFHKNFNS